MEHENPCDTQSSITSHDTALDKSDAPDTNSASLGKEGGQEAAQNTHPNNTVPVDVGRSKTDSSSVWQTKQEVEEVIDSSPPTIDDSSNQEVKWQLVSSSHDMSCLCPLFYF